MFNFFAMFLNKPRRDSCQRPNQIGEIFATRKRLKRFEFDPTLRKRKPRIILFKSKTF